ncbi:MAG TPA: biopolymer transporter ExbD [Mucilaginibacter sp.]|jgi:biopolymer transport protein ExbD|nr:biopolymer transporter ExbD [Mucilaginibacter sp.]
MAELNSSPGKKPGRRGSSRKAIPRVDLTAMVDLAFLLITFFMLTTVLTKPKWMPVVMPVPGPPGKVPETSTMSICLGKNNQAIWYVGMPEKPLTVPKQVSYGADLSKAIYDTEMAIYKRSGKGMFVIIKPADHSRYDNLVTTLDDMNIFKEPIYAIAKITPPDVDLLKKHGIF